MIIRSIQTTLLIILFVCCGNVLSAQSDDPTLSPTDSTMLDTTIFVDSAQPRLRIGAYVGPTFNNAKLDSLPLDPSTLLTPHVGVTFEMEFVHPLYFQLDVEYITKGIVSNFTSSGGEVGVEKYRFTYLNVPLLFRFHLPIASGISVSSAFGGAPSFLLAKVQSLSFRNTDTTIAINRGLKNYDFSLEFRAGLEYALTSTLSVSATARYLLGMENVLVLADGIDPRSWKSRGLAISFGISHQIMRSIKNEKKRSS